MSFFESPKFPNRVTKLILCDDFTHNFTTWDANKKYKLLWLINNCNHDSNTSIGNNINNNNDNKTTQKNTKSINK